MKINSDEYIINQDGSVTFLKNYNYAHGGTAKKGETLSPMEIRRRDIMFYNKPVMQSWGYNCEDKILNLNKSK